MIPKRIVLENFLSFGSPATEIVFADDEPLWVLGGPNGVGKSAVFDALTYCLFGRHRGSGSREAKVEELIRHGANGFRVVFEFEFNGTDYRITRTRSGRTTQKVERRHAETGRWEPVPNVNSAAEVTDWSERTLGLPFDAFKASVLLRQGESDAIITAGGADRLKILKKIIAAERFEQLSTRVHGEARRRKELLDPLRVRRDGLTEVTHAEVHAAQDALAQAEAERTAAQHQAVVAAGRVVAAKQWAVLEGRRSNLEEQLRAANARAAVADRIRADKARLDALTAAVPTLRQVVALRAKLATADGKRGKLQAEKDGLETRHQELTAAARQAGQKSEAHRATAAEHAREVERLRGETDREAKFIAAADTAASLQARLNSFPPDLADQRAAAREKVRIAAEAVAAAGKCNAEVTGLLRQARGQQKKFEGVETGVKCSRCGQEVTAEHAAHERDRLTDEVRALEQKLREAEAEETATTSAKEAGEAERDRLDEACQEQAGTSQRLADQLRTLAGLGVHTDAKELRNQLAAKAVRAEDHEARAAAEVKAHEVAAAEATQLGKEGQGLEKRRAELDKLIRAAEQAAASDCGQHETLVNQLAPEWQSRLDDFDAAAVQRLDSDRQALDQSGAADAFRRLEQDAALRDEWVKQLGAVQEEVATIPAESRVSTADAERHAEQARQTAAAADEARDAARAAVADRARRAEEYRQLVAEIAAAEKQAEVHRKLDELLGRDGLQRELVRDAERQIVRLANDTVQNLSDGDLSVELDDGADGGDEAFALRVRRAEDPTPIGVNYLSGSQKFRVAVSVALAIGRFAAGQARPLESVIIDEGFGSLDRDGLRAAADELNRLRQHLRRIVLVSHQEEFADRFPVVIKLTRGENGTTAEAVRR